VEGAPADEHVRDAARLERLDVRPRDVGLPADEAAEEQADVLGRTATAPSPLRSVTFQPLW
jgi:hypothetical protein